MYFNSSIYLTFAYVYILDNTKKSLNVKTIMTVLEFKFLESYILNFLNIASWKHKTWLLTTAYCEYCNFLIVYV